MQQQRYRHAYEPPDDSQLRRQWQGPIVLRNGWQRKRDGRFLPSRTRERNDIAEISGRTLRRLVATRDQDNAVEAIGAAPIVRSGSDHIAWLWDLPDRH
jgi:hypothetical protein